MVVRVLRVSHTSVELHFERCNVDLQSLIATYDPLVISALKVEVVLAFLLQWMTALLIGLPVRLRGLSVRSPQSLSPSIYPVSHQGVRAM